MIRDEIISQKYKNLKKRKNTGRKNYILKRLIS
jgi:hypothetical protein